jgi:hypothetical protein
MKKVNITKDFLSILKEEKSIKQKADEALTSNTGSNLQDEAKLVLDKLGSKSIGWDKLFNAVEEFRQDIRQRDKRNTTANDRQVGMAAPLLVLFELILTTDLQIYPIDKDIIIKTMADNFTSKTQVEELKKLASIISADITKD